MKKIVTIMSLLLLVSYSILYAQWSNDPTINTPICTAVEMQYHPEIINDGAGGAFITWEDTRNYSDTRTDIYAQHIDSAGYAKWTIDGLGICTESHFQYNPVIVSDKLGGAIIIWADARSYGKIYAQRISASGILKWETDGVEIGIGGSGINIISDGAGGCILTWFDNRSGNDDIYAQRVDSSGTVLWTADGVPICTAVDDQRSPDIVADGEGGAIIMWDDSRNGFNNDDIYAQRIDSTGSVYWLANGIAICAATGSQYGIKIISDGANGAIVVWTDERSGMFQNDLYAQQVSGSGTVMWTANGVPVCTESGNQLQHNIVSDGNEGVIIAWTDERSIDDIYAQRIDENGIALWQQNGIEICTATWIQEEVTICYDGNGGAIIVWNDDRDNDDIYAQRIDALGVVQWSVDGVPISIATGSQHNPKIAGIISEGTIIAWEDERNGFSNSDIYAQYVNLQGTLSSIEEYNPEIIPEQFILSQNYPNPFNPTTVIKYSVPNISRVTIKVFDLLGNEIETLVDEEKSSGNYQLTWHAENLTAGIYFYRIAAEKFIKTKKMVLLK